MNHRTILSILVSAVFACLAVGRASAQLNVGSDGSDGALNVTAANLEIDLSLAATGTWTDPSPVMGQGVYDPVQWAVVFKYSSVNIQSPRIVTFKNHPSRAPVVWLVQGSVTIAGTVSVDGKRGHTSTEAGFLSEPGPGGFRGGRAWFGEVAQEVAGFGPGGARLSTAVSCGRGWGGSFGSLAIPGANPPIGTPGPTYGNVLLVPLLGGSGAAGIDLGSCPGNVQYFGSGAGGGALLVAAAQSITLTGSILARGGNEGGGSTSGGAGGGIRLIADQVGGTGILRATGGTASGSFGNPGGNGRIRVEANLITLADPGIPSYTFGLPSDPPMIFPPALTPKVHCVTVAGTPVPTDPHSSLNFPLSDTSIAIASPVTIVVEGENVPLTWMVEVRSVPRDGVDTAVFATLQPGSTEALSTWHATLAFPNGFAAVQARAFQP